MSVKAKTYSSKSSGNMVFGALNCHEKSFGRQSWEEAVWTANVKLSFFTWFAKKAVQCSQAIFIFFFIIRKHAELLIFVPLRNTNPNVLISCLCISASGFLLSQPTVENICHSFFSAAADPLSKPLVAVL